MLGFWKRKKEKQQNKRNAGEKQRAVRGRNDETTLQIKTVAGGLVTAATATHLGTRETQQDAAYACEQLQENGLAFGVLCDGMGGMEGGERASSDTVVFLANRVATLDTQQDIPAFLRQAAMDANELLLSRNAQTGQNAGTTLVAVLVRGSDLFWLSVGDSRIYILREGEIVCVTRDHNFLLELQKMVDAGIMTQEEANGDTRREALLSYIGAPALALVDCNPAPFQLQAGDLVLLCSDGLTKTLSDGAILEVVRHCRGNITECARMLPATAFDAAQGGVMDNTTVVLLQYQ